MKRLNLDILREYNKLFEYNLPEETLNEILDELSFSKFVHETDILDEFECYTN
jgi:hypothetical protein